MSLIAPGIVEVFMNKIVLWINVGVDDGTTERAIIASINTNHKKTRFESFEKIRNKLMNLLAMDDNW